MIAAGIDHPNVIPIYDAGDVDGLLYIAMRYVDGSDLSTLLRREGRLDLARTLAIMTQVAGALDAAHARGLVHRDVKPSNILLAPAAGGHADRGAAVGGAAGPAAAGGARAGARLPARRAVGRPGAPGGRGSRGLGQSPLVGRGTPGHELDSLLDSRTKGKARTAPLALFVLVALVVIVYLATAR